MVGGVIAAVIGFGVAQVVPDGWPVSADTAVTDALAQADAELQGALSDKADASAVSSIEGQLVALSDQISALSSDVAALSDSLGAQDDLFEARISALEDRPIVDLSSLDNSEAADAELAALRGEIAAVSAEAQRQIEAARNEATLLEQNAAAAAEAAAQRAALSRVLAALDSGVPYEATLLEFAEIADTDIPEGLSASAADGVATLASLQDSFPEVARAALSAMRADNAGGKSTMGNFFRNQFSVRSLEPQEGDSPDAVLSRVEGALTEGRLEDALSESDALPEAGASIIAPWRARAEARIAALAAADALTQTMTSN